MRKESRANARKSTLLNELFGAGFTTMTKHNRQQTTKGIWLACSEFSQILIMDVEGTDGRERGDDQDFERKSALFSLAISDVLVINMWENQVGLYNGANMGRTRRLLCLEADSSSPRGF